MKETQSQATQETKDLSVLSPRRVISSPKRSSKMTTEKLRRSLQVPLPSSNYQSLPIQPGFLFLDGLLKAPRAHITSLQINIPESLYSTDKLYYIKTEESGFLNVSTEIHNYKFVQILEADRKDQVAAILRLPDSSSSDMNTYVMSWDKFKVKLIGQERIQRSLIQRFINCSSSRPSVTRLYYYSESKQNKANFAHFINKLESGHNLQDKIVNVSEIGNIEIFKIAGSPLKPFEKEAKKIVKYLNRGYNLRIQEIVLDFVKDKDEKLWLLGCKGFVVDESILHQALPQVTNWWPDMHLDSKKWFYKPKKMTSSILCKLCQVHYPKHELNNLISVRMLIMYHRHINNRQNMPFKASLLKVSRKDMLSQSMNICQYCYLLVTCELQLMEVQNKLARKLNVQKLKDSQDERLEMQLQFLPKDMAQWRILVVAHRLFDCKLPRSEHYYIHFKFDSVVTSFKIRWREMFYCHELCLPLNMTRLYYFFTDSSLNVKNFVENFEFEVWISQRNKQIASGTSSLLAQFPRHYYEGEAYLETKQIYLHDKSFHSVAMLNLSVGISFDKILSSNKIDVLVYKYMDVFLASAHCMTADPLPCQWMECFGDYRERRPTLKNENSLYEQDYSDENEEPFLLYEKRRMSSMMNTRNDVKKTLGYSSIDVQNKSDFIRNLNLSNFSGINDDF